jgi:hypothetical protein
MALITMDKNRDIIPQIRKINVHQQEIKDLELGYITYSKKFEHIMKLEQGDKLARDCSGVYYKHVNTGYFIQLRRWWTNQGREQTFTNLDEDFTTFMKYLDTVLNMLNITYDISCRNISKKIGELAKSLTRGLYMLKKTYPGDKKLVCKIDSIILSLIDFKNRIGEKLDIKIPISQQRQRTFSN